MKKSLFVSSVFLAGAIAIGQRDAQAGGFAHGRSVHTNAAGGTVQHQSGAAVGGVSGSANTQGAVTKNADGTVSGSRTTAVQSKTSAASYQGDTTYNAADGLQHTASCTNTEGEIVTCHGQK